MPKNFELRPDEMQFAEKFWALTEKEKNEILPKLTGCQKRFFRSFPVFYNYKIIAEVVKADNCMRNAAPGKRIVFNGMGAIQINESTLRCIWAATEMLPIIYGITDRIMDGLEPDLAGMDYFRCPDVEPEAGGMGSVLFKVKVLREKCVMPASAHRPGIDAFFSSPHNS